MKRIEAGRESGCAGVARVSFVMFALMLFAPMLLPPDVATLSVRTHSAAARAATNAQPERELEQIVKRLADTSGGV
ncbi:MAG TPA: hypothetical protein VEX60_00450, partial [Pyrinomonadaceae bacterium]|nr:hypothetical protein [Pyrinomonadaceae bacterium]